MNETHQQFEFVPNPEEKESKKYKLELYWSHGDADHNSTTYFESNDKAKIIRLIEVLFNSKPFFPNKGYMGLGYYLDPESQVLPEELGDIRQYDACYGNCFAVLEDFCLYIDNIKHVIIDHEARKHVPKITLPKVGDSIKTNTGELPALKSANFTCGRHKIPTYVNAEDWKSGYRQIKGKVVETSLIDRQSHYDTWEVVLYVEEYDVYVGIRLSGVAEKY